MRDHTRGWTGARFATALLAIGAVVLGCSARASSIAFTPQGSGTSYTIGGIDPAPGNALAVGALPLHLGETFQLDYQATVPALIGTNGLDFTPSGLGSTYQLTVVGSFTEVVTSLSSSGTIATLTLAPTQSPNSFFELYYNPKVVANNLAGTGFNVGTLVMAATPAPSLPSVTVYSMSMSGGNPVITSFDKYINNDYPGISTVAGSGSALFTANVSYYNPEFFGTRISEMSFNSSIVTPFNQVNPSALFVGAPGTAPPSVVPHIGTINGENGRDFQLQADSNLSFTAQSVPEPASIILASLGLLGAVGVAACARKRKSLPTTWLR
jgi:hypothetical protein